MERSAEEIKKINIATMGEALGVVYSELWQEVGRLFSNWAEYVSLFGTSPARIDLLNSAAGHFFRTVQDSLWDRTLLNIARITDPARTGKRKNLSIHSLSEAVVDPVLKKEIELAISVAQTKSAFARDWRNRHIAHADFELAVAETAEPLASASRQKVKEALISIQDVLNTVSRNVLDSTTCFGDMALLNSAEDLLYLIDFAIRKRQEQHQRIESGEYTDADLTELRARIV